MNLGQFLTDKSPLASGTVAEHLAAIYAQTGSGPGETVFASRFYVAIEEEVVNVAQSVKKQAPEVIDEVPKRQQDRSAPGKFAFPFLRHERVTAIHHNDAVCVVTTQATALATQSLESITIRKRGKK